MADWTKIGTLATFSLIIFVILPKLGQFLLLNLLDLFSKHETKCDRLLWEDVPDGELHECTTLGCQHELTHRDQGRKCWEGILPVVFSRAWIRETRRNADTVKPKALPVEKEYLEIDFSVFMGFILSTFACGENPRSMFKGFSTYHTDDRFIFDACGIERVDLKFHGDYAVVHLRGSKCRPWVENGDKAITSWTKKEIENLLDGYPPLYSAMITLRDGVSRVTFPISSREDIVKGGWVIATKLGQMHTALPIYFESQDPTRDIHRKPTFQRATEWVRDIVAQPFTLAFPDDHNVRAALKALNSLCDGETYITGQLEGSDLDQDSPNTFNSDEAIKAMQIFNRPTSMTQKERDHLRADAEPILVPLLSAAVYGTRDVLRFEKDCVDFTGKLPPPLRPSSRIFVRDCVVNESSLWKRRG
jgi:hypothetical protein